MSSPCNQQPMKWVSCCQIIDCLDIQSSNNTVTVTKSDCGVDLTITGNNLDQIIKLNEGDCISFVKEFVDGVLNFTPQIDAQCLADATCGLCPPVTPPVTCPAPLFLSVTNV